MSSFSFDVFRLTSFLKASRVKSIHRIFIRRPSIPTMWGNEMWYGRIIVCHACTNTVSMQASRRVVVDQAVDLASHPPVMSYPTTTLDAAADSAALNPSGQPIQAQMKVTLQCLPSFRLKHLKSASCILDRGWSGKKKRHWLLMSQISSWLMARLLIWKFRPWQVITLWITIRHTVVEQTLLRNNTSPYVLTNLPLTKYFNFLDLKKYLSHDIHHMVQSYACHLLGNVARSLLTLSVYQNSLILNVAGERRRRGH